MKKALQASYYLKRSSQKHKSAPSGYLVADQQCCLTLISIEKYSHLITLLVRANSQSVTLLGWRENLTFFNTSAACRMQNLDGLIVHQQCKFLRMLIE